MRGERQAPDVVGVVVVVAVRRGVVLTAGREAVRLVVNDLRAVKGAEYAHDETPVPLVRHSPPVVTLSGQILKGFQWWFVVVIGEHLKKKCEAVNLLS